MRINYKKLGLLLLPTFLRSRVLGGFVKVLLSPLQSMHDENAVEHEDRMYGLQCTGQVCRLKDALNKYFGVGQYDASGDYSNGFVVRDVSPKGDWLMVYDEVQAFEESQVVVGGDAEAEILCDEAEIMLLTDSFEVVVPPSLGAEILPEVRAIVERYRLASRRARYC